VTRKIVSGNREGHDNCATPSDFGRPSTREAMAASHLLVSLSIFKLQ
jgi:hypothetical protein